MFFNICSNIHVIIDIQSYRMIDMQTLNIHVSYSAYNLHQSNEYIYVNVPVYLFIDMGTNIYVCKRMHI